MLDLTKSLRWIREEKCGTKHIDEKRPHYLVYRNGGTKILKIVYNPDSNLNIILIGQNSERILLSKSFENSVSGLKESREYGKEVYRKLMGSDLSYPEKDLKSLLQW